MVSVSSIANNISIGADGLPYKAVYVNPPLWLNFWFMLVLGIAIILLGLGIWMFIVWKRRKLTFTNFVDKTGHWYRRSWKSGELKDIFDYNSCIYKFDITKCTRDRLNRPIAHYYEGNPEQMIFDTSKVNPQFLINGNSINIKDFIQLMKSKVLKDIFNDDEVMSWLMIIFFVLLISQIIVIGLVLFYHPAAALNADNRTYDIIAQGCARALKTTIKV